MYRLKISGSKQLDSFRHDKGLKKTTRKESLPFICAVLVLSDHTEETTKALLCKISVNLCCFSQNNKEGKQEKHHMTQNENI